MITSCVTWVIYFPLISISLAYKRLIFLRSSLDTWKIKSWQEIIRHVGKQYADMTKVSVVIPV